MWWRRSWFSLKGKAGIPGQTEGCPATSIGPRVLPVGSLQQRVTIPKALRPVQVMAEVRFHGCPQNLRSFRKSALYVVNHAVDVGQHACRDAAWVHLGMARQKADYDCLKRDHSAVQVRGWVVLGFISH